MDNRRKNAGESYGQSKVNNKYSSSASRRGESDSARSRYEYGSRGNVYNSRMSGYDSRESSDASRVKPRKATNYGSYGTRRVSTEQKAYSPSIRIGESKAQVRAVNDSGRRKREAAARRKRRQRRRLRAAIIIALGAVIAAVLICMTPLFDIGKISLEGNDTVTKNEIQEKVGYLIGRNVFATRRSVIEKQMKEISRVSEVSVKKHYFPATVSITIKESNPAAYLLAGGATVVIDSSLKVIDDSGMYSTDDIPSLSGVSVSSYKLNEQLETESEEKDEVLSLFLESAENLGLIPSITYISLDDMTNISFNYENRIDVSCGSQLELERKLRMFEKSVESASLSSNAIGSMDLSTPGKAVYTP